MEIASASFCFSGAALGAALASLIKPCGDRKRECHIVPNMGNSVVPGTPITEHSPWMYQRNPHGANAGFGVPVDAGKEGPLAAGWEGFSMEDARQHAAEGAKRAQEVTPAQVLSDLQRGNFRFWTGAASRPDSTAFERRALMTQQFPRVAVLGCSDSRVPTEIVFDQGLGDIFVVRVAGNFLETATAGSLQYAVDHLKVKVLIVLGHEGCGAIKAACLPLDKIKQQPADLSSALQTLKAGLDEDRLQMIYDCRARDREAVVTNVRRQVEKLARSKCIMRAVKAKELIIVGAFYEISSGIVDFFHEVSDESVVSAPSPHGPSDPATPSSRFGVMNRLNVEIDEEDEEGKQI